MKSRLKALLIGSSVAMCVVAAGSANAEDYVFHDGVTPVEGAEVTTYEPSGKDSYTIGLSNISLVNTWRVQMIEEAKYQASQYDKIGEFLVTDAGGSSNKQLADIEDLIARGVDALLVTPGSESALNAVLEKAYEKGIVVIIFSSAAYPENYTSKILADERYFGQIGAEYLAKAMGGKGKVIGLRGIAGNSIDKDRWDAAVDVFDRYDDIKVIDSAFGDWAYDKGKSICESLIIAHPDIDGIWSSGGAMTQACAEVMDENGLPLVPMSGEANNGFLRTWQDMDLESVAPVSSTWVGAQAVTAAMKALEGEPLAKDYLLRPDPITQDEISEFYEPDFKDSYWTGSILPHETLVEMYGK